MAPEAYPKKRDFGATTEPRGGGAKGDGDAFVVKKHAARRLHYDPRLELDGVPKSWAVTRGPSLVAGEKRLAVHVEDHPLEYGDFEGVVATGQYGAGAVILWDRGTWTPLEDAAKGYAKGHLEFTLQGRKLGGRWRLVRMAPKPGETRENWPLIKGDDAFARLQASKDVLDERPESVKTGRSIAEIADEARPAKARPAPTRGAARDAVANLKGARRAAAAPFVEPMLASLRSSPPAGEQWLHEIKFDGYRLQARIEDGSVRPMTRSGQDWTTRFGERVTSALGARADTAVLDGDLVVENDAGASDFSALQADRGEGRADRFVYYAFDLLYLDGHDLRGAPLLERKALLERLTPPEGAVRFSSHFVESGALGLRHACRLGLEGVLSKLRD